LLLTAAGCVAGIQLLDLPVAVWLHAQAPRGSGLYHAAVQISGFGRGHFYIVPALLCACVWWRRRNPARLRAALLVAAAWAASGLSCLALKGLFGRCRPSQYFTANEYGFRWFQTDRHYTSFPSGHSADVFAVAALLWLMFPRWRPVWAAWSVLMAASRVVSQNHYLSDTVAGAVLGVFVAWGVRTVFVRRGWYAAGITPSGATSPRSS
jgi:membrane-associated phospholipid phosphatase